MTNVKIPNSLVSVQFLAENLSAENLIVLDASMKPVTPVANTGPAATRYIPNSLRFDFDNEIRDHNTSLPHMMPSPEFFSDEMQKMGINKNSAIVVYDNVGVYASPRAWWMFRAMGHDQIAVLDGGLPAWITAGYETVTQLKEKPEKRGDLISQPQDGMFVDSSIVLNALNDENFSVMDGLGARFTTPSPHPPLAPRPASGRS